MTYLDNNATTRIDPEVLEAMLPFLKDYWGNPSSIYEFGFQLRKDLAMARQKVASLIQADPEEVLFTSCGTESNNTAIAAGLHAAPSKTHLIMTAVEHSANRRYAEFLNQSGFEVTLLPVDAAGRLDLRELERSIRPETALVSVMWANNETGVLFPIEAIAEICRSRHVPFHTDAVQAAGKVAIRTREIKGIDYLSLSAHKMRAPKGVGALFVRRGRPCEPFIRGGSQERRRRAGTENVASIVGFGKAAELAIQRLPDMRTRVRRLRDALETWMLETIPRAQVNGDRRGRLPNTTNITFPGAEAEALLLLLDRAGVCASSGSACSTGSLEPSHVLTAMGIEPDLARSSVRFSLGHDNCEEDVQHVKQVLPPAIQQLRGTLVGIGTE